jgi:ubiquinone/menaquinone biosynthesis C-methylase UbiE
VIYSRSGSEDAIIERIMKQELDALMATDAVVEKEGIYVAKEIAEQTVWDKLAVENPTHAVISAGDEAAAAKKSEAQIADIKSYVQKGDVLLDCGTGYGRVAKYLLPQMELGGYIGVDSAYEMLSIFKNRYKEIEAEQRTPLLLLNADIHTLPLADNSVDVVIVCAVFLHNHKRVVQDAVKEISRVLKPGGKLLVYASFPRAATLQGLQGLTYQAFLNLIGKPYKNGPVRYYWRREIMQLFHNFATAELKPYEYAVLPKSLIFLPGFLDKMWRTVIANPVNKLLQIITPEPLKYYCAVHFDVVATR